MGALYVCWGCWEGGFERSIRSRLRLSPRLVGRCRERAGHRLRRRPLCGWQIGWRRDRRFFRGQKRGGIGWFAGVGRVCSPGRWYGWDLDFGRWVSAGGRRGVLGRVWDLPSRLLILLLKVRSGRSMVLATAKTINRLCRKLGQLKKLYMTLWFLVTSWSSSSMSTTHGTRRGLGWSNSLSNKLSACAGLTRCSFNASQSNE